MRTRYSHLLLALLLAALAGCAHVLPAPAPLGARQQVLAAATAYLGAPYCRGGRGQPCLDCSGLVLAAYREVGLDLPRSTAAQMRSGSPVESLEPGDVVFFAARRGCPECRVTHCGIYLGEGQFIHASRSNGVMVSELAERHWRQRYLGGRRYLED